MKLSILSPVYNEAKFIEQAIGSAQVQSHRNWELLFVDDGSSDLTPKLITRAAESDQRIKLVAHGKKLGKVRAFNHAYDASDGDGIMILGGDDVLPPDSLARRVNALRHVDPATPAVASFKFRTLSDDPRYDGAVLPRGKATNKYAQTITINRALAELVFPIDEDLMIEDIWIRYAAMDLAKAVIERQHVVLHYRIHEDNSVSRYIPFSRRTHIIHAEHQTFAALLNARHLTLSPATREQLRQLQVAEELRYSGKTWQLLFHSRLPLMERLAMASMSHPLLFKLRMRFYKFFSGRRGA